ncbi:MAG TPA: GNAT family N-acetyltransferase [Chryseosolibacter sp.]
MVHLDLPEKIETERLLLQRLRYEDAEEIFYTYASKPEATKYLSWPMHRSVEDTRAFIRYAIDAWNLGLDYTFSIRSKRSNKFIGSFGVIHENGRIQFGYVFTPTEWGKGYATEACSKMMSVLKEFPSLFRIGTFVDVDNTASINVLKKSGLVEEARLTRWYRFVNQDNQPKDCILFRLP